MSRAAPAGPERRGGAALVACGGAPLAWPEGHAEARRGGGSDQAGRRQVGKRPRLLVRPSAIQG
jgi:hypothetical protein